MISANTATNTTAQVGVRCELRRRQRLCPGTAPSREKANVIRDALVTHAMPQKICPMVEITRTAFAAAELRAVSMIVCEVPPAALIWLTWVAANVSATSTIQPKIAE